MLIPFSELDPVFWDESFSYCSLMTAHYVRTYGYGMLLAVLGVVLSSSSGYAQGYDVTFDEVDFPSVLPIANDESSAESETGPALEAPEPADPAEEAPRCRT